MHFDLWIVFAFAAAGVVIALWSGREARTSAPGRGARGDAPGPAGTPHLAAATLGALATGLVVFLLLPWVLALGEAQPRGSADAGAVWARTCLLGLLAAASLGAALVGLARAVRRTEAGAGAGSSAPPDAEPGPGKERR